MRVAVMNYSGNVGKTTVARDVFKYRLPDYKLIAIETVNSDGKEAVCIRGEDGEEIFSNVLMTDNAILDIGASNLEYFFHHAIEDSKIISMIDKFVLPTTPERKQQLDTIRTVQELIENQNIDVNKIYILLNRYESDKIVPVPVEDVFADILKLAGMVNINLLSENAIPQNDCYAKKHLLSEMLTNTDYLVLIEEQKEVMQAMKEEGNKNKADEAEVKARAYIKKYIRQKKLLKLNAIYQEICDIIMAG